MNTEVTGTESSNFGECYNTAQTDPKKNLPLRVLREEYWNYWITREYVIVRRAISREAAKRLEEVLW